ncbi:MAG: hypothetical protein MUF35_02350 [Candidatus Nanopelagicales bacterium]|jgi:hypothetical protein|nr:hypothetical protein [Candidatus Nanopelagicales bacterium]
MTGALLPLAESAPVTQWGPRLLLTLATLAILGLAVWGMRRGWRARGTRQADVPTPPAPPTDLAPDPAVGVPGLYVATTSAEDLLDRIVVHGLGHRGRAVLTVTDRGVLVDRVGEAPVWIPLADLRGVRLGSGQAQKAFEAGGLILVRWVLGPREVETGFRADVPEQHIATATALRALVPTAGGTA